MVPKKLIEFIDCLADRNAAKKLETKIKDLQENYEDGFLYTTKIVYHIEEETKVARLIFTNLVGKQSFDVFSGDISEFISKTHTLEDGQVIQVFGIVLNDFLTPMEIIKLNKYNLYCEKKLAKDIAKQSVTVRYKPGDVLLLKGKIRDGSRKLIKKFVVKKLIWSIYSKPVSVLIVQQIEGVNNNMSLTKADCKKYHIKYEENLQVYPMLTKFTKINNK